MKTSKPISTISYNSEEFLAAKIFEWKKAGFIEFAMWIKHRPDTDGTKEHFHVFIQPAFLVQTEFFVDNSVELDKSWKPLDEEFLSNLSDDERKKALDQHDKKRFLKMNVFRSSKSDDWIPYAIHDVNYLTQKNLVRNLHYEFSDIRATCDDTLAELISSAYDKFNNKLEFRLIEAINSGSTWQDIVRSGMVPLKYLNGARLFYMALRGQDNKIV